MFDSLLTSIQYAFQFGNYTEAQAQVELAEGYEQCVKDIVCEIAENTPIMSCGDENKIVQIIGQKGDPGVGQKGDQGIPGQDGTSIPGANGAAGKNGWTPVLACVEDGERKQLQVVAWTGSSGPAPPRFEYLGASGFVSDISQATDGCKR